MNFKAIYISLIHLYVHLLNIIFYLKKKMYPLIFFLPKCQVLLNYPQDIHTLKTNECWWPFEIYFTSTHQLPFHIEGPCGSMILWLWIDSILFNSIQLQQEGFALEQVCDLLILCFKKYSTVRLNGWRSDRRSQGHAKQRFVFSSSRCSLLNSLFFMQDDRILWWIYAVIWRNIRIFRSSLFPKRNSNLYLNNKYTEIYVRGLMRRELDGRVLFFSSSGKRTVQDRVALSFDIKNLVILLALASMV